jgi:hypothetical protein
MYFSSKTVSIPEGNVTRIDAEGKARWSRREEKASLKGRLDSDAARDKDAQTP